MCVCFFKLIFDAFIKCLTDKAVNLIGLTRSESILCNKDTFITDIKIFSSVSNHSKERFTERKASVFCVSAEEFRFIGLC